MIEVESVQEVKRHTHTVQQWSEGTQVSVLLSALFLLTEDDPV